MGRPGHKDIAVYMVYETMDAPEQMTPTTFTRAELKAMHAASQSHAEVVDPRAVEKIVENMRLAVLEANKKGRTSVKYARETQWSIIVAAKMELQKLFPDSQLAAYQLNEGVCTLTIDWAPTASDINCPASRTDIK